MTPLSGSAGSRRRSCFLAYNNQASTRLWTFSFGRTRKPFGTKEGIMSEKTLTLALMDPPYESANSTTALRIVSAALTKGINVNVFAYEGAVNLPFSEQAPHANPVKGTTVEEEDHPTTKNFVTSLLKIGHTSPLLTWVN